MVPQYQCLLLRRGCRWDRDTEDVAVRRTVREFEGCYRLDDASRATFACLRPEHQKKHTFCLDHGASSPYLAALRQNLISYVHGRKLRAHDTAPHLTTCRQSPHHRFVSPEESECRMPEQLNNPFARAAVRTGVNAVVFDPRGAHTFGVVRAARPAHTEFIHVTVCRADGDFVAHTTCEGGVSAHL